MEYRQVRHPRYGVSRHGLKWPSGMRKGCRASDRGGSFAGHEICSVRPRGGIYCVTSGGNKSYVPR